MAFKDSAAEVLHDRFTRLRAARAGQDVRTAQVMLIRQGRMSTVAPDLFPDAGPWQEPIVANMIDIAARDLSETLAPLPAFNCSSPTMVSERERARATERTKIVGGIVAASNLQVQMYTGADQYLTAGFLPFRVEADFDSRMPLVRLLNPIGCYPEFDRFGRLVSMFQRVVLTRGELAVQYPQFEKQLFPRGRGSATGNLSSTVEVILYHDKDWDIAYCTSGSPFILEQVRNPVGKPLIRVAQRPGPGGVPRGQFDDVLFVQIAKAQFSLLKMKIAHDAANSPLTVPSDVAEVPMGPDAVIHTNDPAGVRRVPIEVPQSVFAEEAGLERELRLGSRFPEMRTGNSDAAIVTGRGVQALLGGYESQVRAHQAVFARTLSEVLSLALELDEVLFGGQTKKLRGHANGTPYELSYDPKVIKGDYTVDTQYGLMAGLDPNRWLVFGLQARAEKLFSRDFLMRELPFDIDVEEERQKVDVEDLEDAAKQAIMGYAQSIPALAANGQDPAGPVRALAQVIAGRRKGQSLSDLVEQVFVPDEPEPVHNPTEEAADPQGGPQAGTAAGQGAVGPDGLMRGVAPGQQGMAPGGRPDLSIMLAGLNAQGQANLTAGVSRRKAV